MTFFTKGNKIKQLKEGLEEVINHRPDDFENSYLSKRVPLYGYYRLPEDDLSTDFISMFLQIIRMNLIYTLSALRI